MECEIFISLAFVLKIVGVQDMEFTVSMSAIKFTSILSQYKVLFCTRNIKIRKYLHENCIFLSTPMGFAYKHLYLVKKKTAQDSTIYIVF